MQQFPLSTSYVDGPSPPEIDPRGLARPSESAGPAAAGGDSSQRDTQRVRRQRGQLSCINCQRKKVKCNRADPCSRCERVGAICVSLQPSGAARGRKGGRRKANQEVLDRIAKLENLVKGIEGGYSHESTAMTVLAHKIEASGEAESLVPRGKSGNLSPTGPREGLGRYLGSSVWMSLSDEIHGIYEVLNQQSDDEDDTDTLTLDSSSLNPSQPSESTYLICDLKSLPEVNSLKHPSPSQVRPLYFAFIANVDPVVKILHRPSLYRYLIEQTGEFECSPGTKGWEALRFAIYYCSTTSLTPEECLEQLGQEKSLLLSTFRSSTEIALARADFINSVDLSTLQALVLYLSALRSNETSRRTWTITSLAVRIAHALGIHRETYDVKYPSLYKPFEREMRRRLWWQICNLDRHASVDRGSDPIITPKTFNAQLPLHVNDEDLVPGDSREVQSRDEYTDFTISMVIHEVFDIERRLNYVLAGEPDSSQENTEEPWDMRRSWGLLCQQRIQDKYLRHCNTTVPIQRYTMVLADAMFATMKLWIYRPLQKPRYASTMARIPHSWILHVSLEVVEKINTVLLDPSARPFRWLTTIWISWHALAVMIAELCVQTEGPLVEQAWSLVDVVFEETARHIADSDQGRLWRPIKKLMKKAQAVRKTHLGVSTSISVSMPHGDLVNNADVLPNTQITSTDVMCREGGLSTQDDITGGVQWLQQGVNTTELMSVGWDPWAVAGPSGQMEDNHDLNQMAWTNWENFIDDFQADGGLLSGQEYGLPSSFNMWQMAWE